MPINDQKTRFKMYKAGKLWFTMGTTFLSVAALNTAIVSANEQPSARLSETEKIENKSIANASTEAVTSDKDITKTETELVTEEKTDNADALLTEDAKQADATQTKEKQNLDKAETQEPAEKETEPTIPADTEKQATETKELKNDGPVVQDVPEKKDVTSDTNPKHVEKTAEKKVTPKANLKAGENKQAKVTDPDYPQNMWLDKDENHYNFQQLINRRGTEQIVFSTNRTGDGVVYVFVINNATQQVIRNYVLQRGTNVRLSNGAIVYNDEQYSGLFQSGGSNDTWARGYSLGAYNPRDFFTNISYFVPELIEQTVSYVDEKGNNIIDINGQEIKPEVQQGLTGQKYTTSEPKFIQGFYNEHYLEKPENSEGTMSQFGKLVRSMNVISMMVVTLFSRN